MVASPNVRPIFRHASGRWAKKVKGRTYYFGPWGDREAALANWMARKAEILGEEPKADHRRAKADFPLFKHGNRWCKKVHGKHEYFGPVAGDDNGEAALGLNQACLCGWLAWGA